MENKIRALARLNNMNLGDLSKETGIKYATIARWGRNEQQPNLCDGLKICKVLNCSLDDLVKQDGDTLKVKLKPIEDDW